MTILDSFVENSLWFAGEHVTLADLTILANVTQIKAIDSTLREISARLKFFPRSRLAATTSRSTNISRSGWNAVRTCRASMRTRRTLTSWENSLKAKFQTDSNWMANICSLF